MKKFYPIIVTSLIALLLVGCAANPKLTNVDRGLYNVNKLDDDALEKSIIEAKVSVIPPQKVTPPAQPLPKGFMDLDVTIQKEYLGALKAMFPNDPDKLIEYLKKPIADAPKTTPIPLPVDYTTIKARFLLSNTKRFYKYDEHHLADIASKKSNKRTFTMLHPNTRLEYLNTRLRIKDSDKNLLEIQSLDRLENEFEVIDLGTLKRNQELTFNSKITGSYGGEITDFDKTTGSGSSQTNSGTTTINEYDEFGNLISTTVVPTGSTDNTQSGTEGSRNNKLTLGATAEASLNNKETIDEALNLKYNRLKSGVSFDKQEMAIAQRGGVLRDISDNVVVTAFLKYSNPTTTSVYSMKGMFNGAAANPASKVTIAKRNIEYIPCTTSEVKAKVTIDGVIRQVRNQRRGRNGFEYDDKVTYQLFDYETDDVIINLESYCRREYQIQATFKDGSTTNLQVELPIAEDLLLFEQDNYKEAFLWVKRHIEKVQEAPNIASVDRSVLQHNLYTLKFEYPRGNYVNLVHSSISDSDLDNLRKIVSVRLEKK